VSRLSDLIANAEAKDPQLGTDLECEFRALSSRLSLGFNFDRQTREDWSSSDKTSSKGEARRVSVWQRESIQQVPGTLRRGKHQHRRFRSALIPDENHITSAIHMESQ
jgi:hypothetical protein